MDDIKKIKIRVTGVCTYVYLKLYEHNIYQFKSTRCKMLMTIVPIKNIEFNDYTFDLFYENDSTDFSKKNLKLLKILDKL
jgi:hypothetical protein